jgi:DNA-binding MarR family transcriptional regulator
MTRSTAPAFVDDYLPALLAQASQLISAEFHKVARANGFSVSEWRVLASLAGGQAVSISTLAQVSVTKGPTATRLLDRMESRRQVQRLPHAEDRRVTLVRITPEGRRTVARLIALAKEHERRVLEPFGLQHAEVLKATLRRMIELHRSADGTSVPAARLGRKKRV